MLRTSLRYARAAGSRLGAAAAIRQSQPARLTRCYAIGTKSTVDRAKLPRSQTTTGTASSIPVLRRIDAEVADSTVKLKQIPLTPPTPAEVGSNVTESTTLSSKDPPSPPTSSPPPPPAPAHTGFIRRSRHYLLTLLVLGTVGFGGGVWYSRINDDFHDFFTEYVPFGERAVLALEEKDLKKCYPRNTLSPARSKDTGAEVRIAPQSGASWRVADSGEPAGRTTSATHDSAAAKVPPAPAHDAEKQVVKIEEKPVLAANDPPGAPEPVHPTPAEASQDLNKGDTSSGFKPPEVDEPSRFPPAPPIDALTVNDADEPVVQDLVKMLNDIITVINAQNIDGRFSSTVEKAKTELNKVGSKIRALKTKADEDAAAGVATKINEFEELANQLITRVDRVMASQEIAWRTEFKAEMRRIHDIYDTRVQNEITREHLISDQKLQNQLLQQAIQLKRQFTQDVKDAIEAERNHRLGKLDQLSSRIKELEQLTTGWNDVVDLSLKAQQLHIAVEAVRASLEDSEHPRPFVRELVALREIASDDPVVNAAIASVNPSAYQRGIATPAQLIDRFRRVASEVRKASLLPEGAGVASHASSLVLSKLMFKKGGLAAGDDVESILTRTQTYLEEGDLDKAAREMNGLNGWAKTLSRDWLGEVRKVLEVQQALEVISTEARLQSLKVES